MKIKMYFIWGALFILTSWQPLSAQNNALTFDGSDDYVALPSSLYTDNLSGKTALTIEYWFKGTELLSAVRFQSGEGYVVAGWSDPPQFIISTDGLTNGVTIGTSGEIEDGNWHHIACVWKSNTENGFQTYVDGVLKNQRTSVNVTLPTISSGAWLGSLPGNQEFLNGSLDEVRIWNTARTATEIRENMMRTLDGDESGLVAYYRLNEASGTTAYDAASNGYNGTLTNMDESSDWVDSESFTTWMGGTSSDWSTASNWSDGVPTSSDNVGIYKWTGNNDAIISGAPEVNNMVISSTSSPTFSSGITVSGSLFLEKDLDLNGQTVTLGSSATLVEDAGVFSGTSGAITTTRSLGSLSSEDVAGLGAVITTSANMGSTTITRNHAAASGNNLGTSILRQYIITPTTNTGLNATLEFNYLDNELNDLTEANLQLVKSEDSGTTWTEEGGTISTANNTVTLSGINNFSTWTLAESVIQSTANNALDFDGTNDYVITPDLYSSFNGTSRTIELWFYAEADGVILSELGQTTINDGWRDSQIEIVGNTVYVGCWTGTGISYISVGTITYNTWNHVAFLYNASTTKIEGYLNGIKSVNDLTKGIAMPGSELYYALGAEVGTNMGSGAYFNGKIDEVRIWNTARTAAQIRENMTRTLDGDESGLVAYYRLNEASGTTAHDATANSNNGTINGATLTDSEAFTTWLGGSSDWSTASNWTDGVPTTTDNVGIYNWGGSLPEIPDGQTINNLVVGSSATVQLDADKTLAINKNLLNEGTFTIKSASANTGSLIVGGTSNGDINVERYMTGNKWHMVSSPVPGQTIVNFLTNGKNAGVATDGDSRGMMDYEESTNTWNSFFTNSSSGAIDAGIGYALRSDADGVITFTGSLYTGDQNLTLAKTENHGWNLIGNPYPSALKANSTVDATNNLLSVNSSSLDASYVALYIWDEQEGYDGIRSDYAIINHSGGTVPGSVSSLGQNYIQSGQGFFVKAASDGAGFNITKAMQSHQPTVAFKSAQSEWATLALEATMDKAVTSTGIKFRDDMTTGLDVGYDAGVFKTGFNIYTKLVEDNGVDFGLQCLPETGIEEYEIQVGLDAATGGEIVFSIKSENFPSGIVPILNDKQTGTSFTFNNAEDVYTATIGETKGYGRFTLTFSSTTDVDDILSSQTRFKAWYSEGIIIISGEITGEGEITVYDVQGRKLVVEKAGYSNQNRIEVPQATSGIYLVKVKDSNSSEVLKIVQTGN